MGCGSSKATQIKRVESAPLDRLEKQELQIRLQGDLDTATPAGLQVKLAELSGESPTRFEVNPTAHKTTYRVVVKPFDVGDSDQERLVENRKVRSISKDIQKKGKNREITVGGAVVIRAEQFLTAADL